MIDFFTWTSPNGRKIRIMLEETGLAYRARPVNLGRGGQFEAEFLKINPNAKVPAIIDDEGPGGPISIFESGAILIYLAEKTGRFLPAEPRLRSVTLQWLFWQTSRVGPMLGQFGHFRVRNEPGDAYSRQRYTDEAARLFRVLDERLADVAHIAGDYTIADMAIYPWSAPVRPHIEEATGAVYANVARWEKLMAERPAVERGMDTPVFAEGV